MSIEEGNKIIAEFMGFIRIDFHTEGFGRYKHWNIEPFGWFDDEYLLYHSSWDWLMPVVEKIEGLGFGFVISEQYCNILDSKNNASVTGVMYAPTKKEVVFNACVKFIEVHIEQKEYLKILKH